MKFGEVYSQVFEADDFKKTKEYRKLSPKMKRAVDEIFKKMDAKPCLLYTSPSPRDRG